MGLRSLHEHHDYQTGELRFSVNSVHFNVSVNFNGVLTLMKMRTRPVEGINVVSESGDNS